MTILVKPDTFAPGFPPEELALCRYPVTGMPLSSANVMMLLLPLASA
jgi:hypothetical protein